MLCFKETLSAPLSTKVDVLAQRRCRLYSTSSTREQTSQITLLLRREERPYFDDDREISCLHFSAILDVTSVLWSRNFEKFFSWFSVELLLINGGREWLRWWISCEAHGKRNFGSFATVIGLKGMFDITGRWLLRAVCQFVQVWQSAYSGGCVYRCLCGWKQQGRTSVFEMLMVYCCILCVFLLYIMLSGFSKLKLKKKY